MNNMKSLTKSNRTLTEKQEKFLNSLIETKGDLKLSAELAGYSGNHYQVLRSLKEEIIESAWQLTMWISRDDRMSADFLILLIFGKIDPDRLGLGILIMRHQRIVLTAEAGELVAAKWRCDITLAIAIH